MQYDLKRKPSQDQAVWTYLGIGNRLGKLASVVLESVEARANRLGCRELGVE